MKVAKIAVVSLIVATLLSGCDALPFSDVNATRQRVTEYNDLVKGTLDSYTSSKVNATKQKEAMIAYVTQDKEWSDVSIQTSLDVRPLTTAEKDSFELYGVVYDKFFTSIGATSLREVLVINGNDTRMFVTIIWSGDAVVSISRVVQTV